jgi:hypothetical protein
MSKILFWIVVFFLVLLALRLVNLANQKARRDEGRERDRSKRRELPAEPTVRCIECGTYLPKSDAKPVADGYRCPEPGCARRR